MKNTDTTQIRTAFLRAAYRELFGICPEASVIDQLMPEANENGNQKS